MDKVTDAQEVDLVGLDQGHFMTVVITGATAGGAACYLEFKNGGDSTWTIDPNFTGTINSGTVIQRVKCLSAISRIRFADDPMGTPYRVCIVWDVVPNS